MARTADQEKQFQTYKRASDRVRSGKPHAMDNAVCDWYSTVEYTPAQPASNGRWYNLPVAAIMWAADARECER